MTTYTGAKFLLDMFGPRTKAPVFVTSLANERSESGKYPPREIVTRDPDAIATFGAQWDRPGRALYFCVSVLKKDIRRRAKKNIGELICLHLDIDFKNTTASSKQVRAALNKLPLKPHRINHSGHGIHAYWLFKKAIKATAENIERVEAALRRLSGLLAGDPSVCEAARLMRLPGSHNSKFGDWIEVTNAVSRKGGYTLNQLEAWLDTATPVLTRINSASVGDSANTYERYGNAQIIEPPIDVDARLAAMRHKGPGETAIHATQLSVSAALLNRGVAIDEVVARLLAATKCAKPAGAHWDWRKEEREIRAMCESWLPKIAEKSEPDFADDDDNVDNI